MLDIIGTQSRYFNEINISICCKMPLTIIGFGIVVIDPCLNPRMMVTCSISSLVDGREFLRPDCVVYIGCNLCSSASEWQKRYYNILNPAYSVAFWVRYGKLAMLSPIYTEVLGTAKFSGMGIKFWEVRTVYSVKITRAVLKNTGTRTKILALPCPKC